VVQRVERSRGTVVHTYLGQPGSAAQDDRDAVLVRSSTAAYTADATSWQLGRIAACDFRDPADVVVTPWQPARRAGLFYLGLQLDGRGSLTQRSSDGTERTVELAPGRMVVYARNRPFRLSLTGPYHYLVLELAPSELGLDEHRLRHAAANEELGSTPSACLLAGLLGELPDQLPRLTRHPAWRPPTSSPRSWREGCGRCATPPRSRIGCTTRSFTGSRNTCPIRTWTRTRSRPRITSPPAICTRCSRGTT
jgi:hypothetical protein